MSLRSWMLLLGLVGVTLPFTAGAQQKPAQAAGAKDPRVELSAKIPGTKPEDLRESPVPGIYELKDGADVVYVTADGKYALAGDLYELGTNTNLTEKSRRAERVKLLSRVPESQMVVFSPKDPKYTISVFTDVDCSYCRKLHSQIAEYNRLGIKVRYLAFPRGGPNTESWTKAEEVWCASNRGEALTRAKRGESLKATANAKACQSPVERQYELGAEVGVRGTPAILLENGEMLPGYVPPQTLAAHLKGQ